MNKNKSKALGIGIGTLLLLIFFIPLIIPIPPLSDTLPLSQLIDAGSKFVQVNGVDIHYHIYGNGEPIIILLHGFGASSFSWREVINPLSELGTIISYDRPAFGFTERPMPGEWEGENPYDNSYQDDLLIELMDELNIEKAFLIGNSAGGTVAVQTALGFPQRVNALILVDAAILDNGGAPNWIRWAFHLPQVDRLAPWILRNIKQWGTNLLKMAWHDPSKIQQSVYEGYRKPLQVENWDRALWEFTKAAEPLYLENRLQELSLPILIISGDDDRIVPMKESITLHEKLPDSSLSIIETCGHVPQEECPQQFLEVIIPFLLNQ